MASRQPRIPGSCPAGFMGRYTIVAGDTMFKIAQRYRINVATLVAANLHITNPNLIFPGDIICVPADAGIPAGETITLPLQQVRLIQVYWSFCFPNSPQRLVTKWR